MIPIRCGIDLDGVLFDYAYRVSGLAYTIIGKSSIKTVTQEKVQSWDFIDDWPDVTKEDRRKLNEFMAGIPDFWLNSCPLWLVNKKKLLNFTNNPLISVFFISKRNKNLLGMPVQVQTVRSLERCFGIKNPSVFITSDSKKSVLESLSLDYYIDDCYTDCNDAVAVGVSNVYSLDYQYNTKLRHVFSEWVEFVPTVNEFIDIVSENLEKD